MKEYDIVKAWAEGKTVHFDDADGNCWKITELYEDLGILCERPRDKGDGSVEWVVDSVDDLNLIIRKGT